MKLLMADAWVDKAAKLFDESIDLRAIATLMLIGIQFLADIAVQVDREK